MDKVKAFILNNQDKLKYVVLTGAAIGAFNCLTRPDYNMIVYIYMYYVWFMFEDSVGLVF